MMFEVTAEIISKDVGDAEMEDEVEEAGINDEDADPDPEDD